MWHQSALLQTFTFDNGERLANVVDTGDTHPAKRYRSRAHRFPRSTALAHVAEATRQRFIAVVSGPIRPLRRNGSSAAATSSSSVRMVNRRHASEESLLISDLQQLRLEPARAACNGQVLVRNLDDRE
jgi:hypothetical protein